MKKFKTLLSIFWAMFKIGLFTFGGGYAMIAIIERELVERKKWLKHDEFMDIIAIAESSPGPLAVNSATYVGYKLCGVLGSFFATLGVVLPSFTIIFVISLFFDSFLKIEWVNYAFRGIQSCVAFLIISAGIKMLKHLKPTILNTVLISITAVGLLAVSLFAIKFSSILFILFGGIVGLSIYLVTLKSKKQPLVKDNEQENKEEVEE